MLAEVPDLKKAYEGEDIRIDEASGTVAYPEDGRKMFPGNEGRRILRWSCATSTGAAR